MTLFDKLLDYIHRPVFDKDAHSFLAMRVRHRSGAFRWVVSDRVLYGFDGNTPLFTAALDSYTLRSLVDYLWSIDGIEVSNVADMSSLSISATTIIDGAGAQANSNGDALFAYTSLLWMYLKTIEVSLSDAKNSIIAMVDQMSIKTADDDWLDEWGSYFGVLRESGENDADYSVRIVVEVMRPRGNNKALEMAILDQFGQDSTVNDVVRWKSVTARKYDSTYTHNSAILYNSDQDAVYGLFDVVIGYNVESGDDMLSYAGRVRTFIEKFRDGGTQLESLQLSSSQLTDSFISSAADAFNFTSSSSISDTASAPSESYSDTPLSVYGLAETDIGGVDSATTNVLYQTLFDGSRFFDSAVAFSSGTSISEPL